MLGLPARADPPATARCAGCHAEQAAPMAASRHASASGPGLWSQLPTHGPHVGTSLSCLLCHAPASDQQPWIAPGAPVAPRPGQTALEAEVARVESAAVEPNPAHDPHATALGVSCTACHVAGGEIVGLRADPRAPHPVRADPGLADPALCARCHQFGAAAAVNGKPLEDTVAEWKASTWGKAGASCQSCHLPDGRHLFRGIHDRDLVAGAVKVRWDDAGGRGALALANENVGHDFPTYVTPRVVLSVQPLDANGRPVGAPVTQVIRREVTFADGHWREVSDTRVPPGGSARLAYEFPGAARLRATVTVEPDFGYVGIDEGLLAKKLPDDRHALVVEALAAAKASPYVIFDETRAVAR